MKILVLPGNSESNTVWEDKMCELLRQRYDVIQHKYAHWGSSQELISLDIELDRLINKIKADQLGIVAKSAGILVILKGLKVGLIKPSFCIFLGTPVLWASEKGFNISDLLISLNVPSLFIQQKNDPFESSAALRGLLKGKISCPYSVSTINGDDHLYEDYPTITPLVLNFIEKFRRRA